MSGAKWAVTATIPTFPVPSLDAGCAFYLRLGMEVDWRWPEDDPTHAGLLRGSFQMMLAQCEPDAPGDVYLVVDDVDACYAEILAAVPWELAGKSAPERAKRPPESPEVKAYGLRDFSVVDPWGNHVAFGQPTER